MHSPLTTKTIFDNAAKNNLPPSAEKEKNYTIFTQKLPFSKHYFVQTLLEKYFIFLPPLAAEKILRYGLTVCLAPLLILQNYPLPLKGKNQPPLATGCYPPPLPKGTLHTYDQYSMCT